MLKRIPVTHLRPGMYIQELCASWMEHPFWRSSFLMENTDDIRRIAECGIREAWIDTDKGLDVPDEAEDAVVDKARSDREVEDQLQRAAAAPPAQYVPMREELERATQICSRARVAVVSMFSEARMGRAIEAEAALPLVDEISSSVARNPGALISLARLKTADDYTYMHSVAVCALMIALARQFRMAEDQVRQAGLAGLLHDLGKALIPSRILNKPDKLTDAEFDIIKTHPVKGHEMLLETSGADVVALDVCLHHHEKMDGTGYPHRLSGEQISLFAKMGAVCDVYDAITSNRPYKTHWDPGESIRRMAEWSKGHFDETVFHAFVRSVGIYPVGSLVRLESGRLGVILEQGGQSLLKPRLRVFYSLQTNTHIQPETIDLARPECTERIVSTEDPARWHFNNLDQFWRNVA